MKRAGVFGALVGVILTAIITFVDSGQPEPLRPATDLVQGQDPCSPCMPWR